MPPSASSAERCADDAAIDSSSAQNLSLLTELRRAVERNELRLYLQPKGAPGW